MEANEALLNITINGENGDLPDPVPWDSADGDLKAWAAEAVRAGGIRGITADPNVSFQDYVVDRFAAKDDKPNRLNLRPKTPLGA